MLTLLGVFVAIVGFLGIALKAKSDESSELKVKITELQNSINLQSINQQIAQTEKEVEDAKKAYDNSIDFTNNSH